MNFQGKLLHGGRVVLERVAGRLVGRAQPDGSTVWSGSFIIAPGVLLGWGDYTLELDDGTTPGIRFDKVAAGPSLAALVPFEVSGSLTSCPAV
jgi:hypothetical protein